MPVFAYKAADQRGQTIDGVMEAADAQSVVERLQRDAYFPIHVAAQQERTAHSEGTRDAYSHPLHTASCNDWGNGSSLP